MPQASGGVLRTKHETYAAAERMVGALGDRWSEFLPPSAFRRALRKPQPAERDYLAAYVRWARTLEPRQHGRMQLAVFIAQDRSEQQPCGCHHINRCEWFPQGDSRADDAS